MSFGNKVGYELGEIIYSLLAIGCLFGMAFEGGWICYSWAKHLSSNPWWFSVVSFPIAFICLIACILSSFLLIKFTLYFLILRHFDYFNRDDGNKFLGI